MKTIDEVASRLQGAKIVSILDATSGFWQLKLDDESSRLCAFNTPIGRYRFTRLPFRVKCAPEIFQRTMDRIAEDLEAVEVIMDDAVVAGDETTHDERLQKFLDRAAMQGLKLNKEKCKIRQTQVPHVGHLLTSEGLKIDPQKGKGSSRNACAANQRRCEMRSWICTIPESIPAQFVHCGCSAERVGESRHVVSLGPPTERRL